MSRILVTGASGQLARALVERAPIAGHEVRAVGRPDLDITDLTSIRATLAAFPADVVVNAAAYTAVDQAEQEPGPAFAINADGAGNVARAADEIGAPIIHISTDYVFDGTGSQPRLETDATDPINAYGRSKLAGEEQVRAVARHVILRTSWVYSPFGGNFLQTMLRLAGESKPVSVVCDQFGSPTYALDLADGVFRVASNLVTRAEPSLHGVFHLSGTGFASWADFAEFIFATSRDLGGPYAAVTRAPSSAVPRPAPRPFNSRLCCEQIHKTHGVLLPDWRQSTEACLRRLIGFGAGHQNAAALRSRNDPSQGLGNNSRANVPKS